MVFKGPKAILASFLAYEVSDYVDVDPSEIEANLVTDTQIVLRNVQLKPKKIPLRPPSDSKKGGEATMATISGTMEKVVFTWRWFSSSSDDTTNSAFADVWMKDATVTITGMKIKAKIACCTNEDYTATMMEAAQLATEPTEVDWLEGKGGVEAYIGIQLGRIMDSMTLNVMDFEISVETPPTTVVASKDKATKDAMSNQVQNSSDETEKKESNRHSKIWHKGKRTRKTRKFSSAPVWHKAKATHKTTKKVGHSCPPTTNNESKNGEEEKVKKPTSTPQQFAIVVRGTNMKLASLGEQPEDKEQESQSDRSSSLKQRLSIDSFHVEITTRNLNDAGNEKDVDEAVVTYPFIDPFGYSMIGTRYTGERFSSGLETGLDVMGQSPPQPAHSPKEGDASDNNGLVLHAGVIQMQALQHLSEMVSSASSSPPPPKNSGTATPAQKDPAKSLPPVTHSTKQVVPIKQQADTAAPANASGESHGAAPLPMHIAFFVCAIISSILWLHHGRFVQAGCLILLFGIVLFYYETIMGQVLPVLQRKKMDTTAAKSSKFHLPISSVTVILPNATKVTVSMVTITCHADGTLFKIKGAEGLDVQVDGYTVVKMTSYEDGTGGRFLVDLIASSVLIEDNSEFLVGEKHAADTSEENQKSPLDRALAVVNYHPRIVNKVMAEVYGLTMSFRDRHTHSPKAVEEKAEAAPKSSTSSLTVKGCIHIKQLQLEGTVASAKVDDLVQLRDFDVEVARISSFQQVTIHVGEVKNKLLHAREVHTSALRPVDRTGELDSLSFAAESASVTAGYSTNDWSQMIVVGLAREILFGQPVQVAQSENTGQSKKSFQFKTASKSGNDGESTTLKIPFAQVAPLKLYISYMSKVSVGTDSSINIEEFSGDSKTTSKDLIRFYTDAILSRSPHFLTNTEVLGVNVGDTAVATVGNAATGGLGGVVAIVGYDAIKGAIANGKRTRGATPEAGYKPGDFTRGLISAPKEAVRRGGEKRENRTGKKGDDDEDKSARGIEDFFVGTTSGAEEYADENKSRLGSASAGGAAMLVGTLLGGPAVGIPVGIAVGAIVGKAIKKHEKKGKESGNKPSSNEDEKHEKKGEGGNKPISNEDRLETISEDSVSSNVGEASSTESKEP